MHRFPIFSVFQSITATSLFEPRPCLRKWEAFPHISGHVSWTSFFMSLWGCCHCLLSMLLLASLLLPNLFCMIKQENLAESNHLLSRIACMSPLSYIPVFMIILGAHFWLSQCQVQQVISGSLCRKAFPRRPWYTSDMHFPGWEWLCLQMWPGQHCRMHTQNDEWLRMEKNSCVSTVQQCFP